MKLKSKFPLLTALVLGPVALGSRIWLFQNGIDQKGLLSNTHPANALIYILTAAALGLLLLAMVSTPGTYREESHPYRGIPAAVGYFAAAMGVFLTSIEPLTTAGNMIGMLNGILGIAATVCLVFLGLCRILKRRPGSQFHAVVTVYFMFHILFRYQSWNTEPQLQQYFPQLLASVFLMITAYCHTALDANIGNRKAFLFFNYGAAFFCCPAIVGETPLLYLTMLLWTICTDRICLTDDAPTSMALPRQVQQCIDTLENNGHAAYVVGGCVRDHLLGLRPHDYDLCTDATPSEICALFGDYSLVRNGEKHGTVGVVIDSQVYEITTFRMEGAYSDNRHPDNVIFVRSIEEDLSRRDFTVNAMAYSPTRGYADPYNGQQDLKNKILRTVGKSELRFQEDALRILRGVRFAIRFRLTPEEDTLRAMVSCASLMDNLAKERIFTELCAILPLATAADLIQYAPILTRVIPELKQCVNFHQNNPHHIHDVYTHTAHVVETVPPETVIRLAALFHDIGKPSAYTVDQEGIGHFYGHAKISTQLASQVLTRLKAPNVLREQVLFLVENHMTLFEPDKKLLRRKLSKYGLENALLLMKLQKADLIATGTASESALALYDQLDDLVSQIRAEDSCLSVKDLAVNGADLIAMGMAAGPQLGHCLEHLLEQVLDEQLPNEKTALLDAADRYKTDNSGGIA